MDKMAKIKLSEYIEEKGLERVAYAVRPDEVLDWVMSNGRLIQAINASGSARTALMDDAAARFEKCQCHECSIGMVGSAILFRMALQN